VAQGWITLHRRIQTHWIWSKDKPFDIRSAWLDMLLMANHKDNKFPLGSEMVFVPRGSFVTSERKLGERWQWSNTKVRSFLKLLENDEMILKKNDSKKSTITIVNYSIYQDIESTETSEEKQLESSRASKEHTNNNDNKDNNDNNKIIKHKHGAYAHVLLKDSELEKLNIDYGEGKTQEAILYLDEYIEMKGYKAKSHYLCIKKWVFDAIKNQPHKKNEKAPSNNSHSDILKQLVEESMSETNKKNIELEENIL
jgi:hypothetical protein